MRRFALGVLCGLVAVVGATASDGSIAQTKDSLRRIASLHKVARLDPTLAGARSGPLDVELLAARPREARTLVAATGGRVERSSGGVLEARVPARALRTLARSRAIRFVRRPLRPVADSVHGQGVNAIGAAAWHRAGINGEGVKVAVVDLGFGGYRRSEANGDLPTSAVTVNFCGAGQFEGTSHGTAVAEIVAEVAPAADLYLICVHDAAGLGLALTYARAHGITIISHSASWFNTSRGDGTGGPGTPEGVVAAARAAGILWVNAAGNRAQQHWSGSFVDTNGNGWNEFAPGDEGNTVVVPASSAMCAALKWDDWPASAEDYDLYLVAPGGAIVARSTNPQTGTEPPTEFLCQINGSTTPQTYSIAIRANRVTGKPVRFDLFLYPGPNLEYQVPAGSITEPGSSPYALTVGAVCWQDNRLEPYSSQGPTIDGRAKPDLVGPDSVSSYTFGPFSSCGGSGFAGTSASAPHVAAAAALVEQANPSFGPDQIEAYLEQRAIDLGPAGRDPAFGSGALSLGAAPRIPLGACVVPGVVRMSLTRARAAIRRAGCAVGRVQHVRSRARSRRVVGQSPRAGTRLAAHGRVNLVVAG